MQMGPSQKYHSQSPLEEVWVDYQRLRVDRSDD